ncbi:TonB-dependent receptor plug domain-containing protein, partial [Sphingobium sp. BHU LFT2]|uniref:TonB-dependent siderophore receptor n=1 Tax=Sphingobium sp. BHU LFT2 TaxID=2807634 RepID=UPI001BE59E71
MGVVTGLRRSGRGNSLLALSASIATLAMSGMIAPTVAQAQVAQRQIDIDIPAQDLNSALLTLTKRAGLQIVYDADKVAGRRSAAVKGRLAPVEALSRLLTGPGLTFRITGNNRIAVEPAPQTVDGSVQLGPVRVEGANGGGSALFGSSVSDPTSTEGTKSYAAPYGSVGSKMATSLREVPHSVSVLTEQRIEDQGLMTIHDVMNQVTGITLFEGTLVNSRYMSRGFAITSARADGGAAIEMPSGVDTDMAFYEHIEVMRGSDGLFGGQGEPGGVLNLVRKKPTATPQFIGQVQAGSWNNYRAEVDASGPLGFNGALRGRVVAAYQNRDFFQRGADLDRKLFYAVLEADLSPSTPGTVIRRMQTGSDAALNSRVRVEARSCASI